MSSHIELRVGNIFPLLKPSQQQQDNFRQICRGIAIACYAEARYLRLTIDKDLISEEKLFYLYFIRFTLGYGSLAFILSQHLTPPWITVFSNKASVKELFAFLHL